ncbi:arylalkylamine N-acetyltransferase 1-like [Onthophagus taurus]|uniref:arylalkylamine N-acetyltransferase 1-like n=1 Tax=Onthophagus taurus TaxID=166361 RepID=UPI000C2089FC|nr:uncharacterized protein LOC111427405 [Onthophagus taurus]
MAIRYLFTQIRHFGMKSLENLQVQVIRQGNRGKARKFLRQHFYDKDPLLVSLNLHKSPSGLRSYEKFLEEAFRSEMSLIMVNRDKEIVGISLNRIISEYGYCFRFHDERCQKIAYLVEAVDEKCKLFQTFAIDQYVKMEALTADPTVEGDTIQRKLIAMTKHLAHERNMSLIRMDTTGSHHAKIARKLGFTPIYTVNYENYILDDKPVFQLIYPNTGYSVFVQTIHNENNSGIKRKKSAPTFTRTPINDQI